MECRSARGVTEQSQTPHERTTRKISYMECRSEHGATELEPQTPHERKKLEVRT